MISRSGVKKMSIEKATLELRAIPPSIEERNGSYYITQSPITFEAVVLRFKEGLSPETIRRDCFPTLSLAGIYSVISFYLNNQAQVDNYLKQVRLEEDELQQRLLTDSPESIKTAEELREQISTARRE
jgi:uncharacterized protein (DUF433 family)